MCILSSLQRWLLFVTFGSATVLLHSPSRLGNGACLFPQLHRPCGSLSCPVIIEAAGMTPWARKTLKDTRSALECRRLILHCAQTNHTELSTSTRYQDTASDSHDERVWVEEACYGPFA